METFIGRNGEAEAALADYDHAVTLDPMYANAFCNRGVILESLHQLERAQESYARAILLNPTDALAFYNRGSVLRELNRPDEALDCYERAILLNPAYAEAYCNRGLLLLKLNQWEAALACYDRCIETVPNFHMAYFNRGDLHSQRGNWEAALADYDRSIRVNPGHAESYCNRGVVLARLRRLDDAKLSYDRAIVLRPHFTQAFSNRAALYSSARQDAAALADCNTALGFDPGFADALQKRGQIYLQMKRFDEAIADFKQAMNAAPDAQFLLGTIRHARMTICDWSEFDSDLQRLLDGVEAGVAVTTPMPMLALTDSRRLHLKAARIFAREEILIGRSLGPFLKRVPAERIRIGYFSADFHVHPVAVLMAEVFELHDRKRFDTIAFSYDRGAPDEMRTRLEKAFTRFIDVRGSSDAEIAELARSLQVDIAVDLGGYTAECRPGIFAFRAAPIQINYLGYPGTLGVEYMDYIIADRVVIPPAAQVDFAENVICMPHSFLPNDSTRTIDASDCRRVNLGLPVNGIVFCCFNNSYKILPMVFDQWMRILKQVDGSVIWLSQNNLSAVNNLRGEAASRDIDPARLIFAEREASWAKHLARHRAADLFLDTRPYNAHATAVDALWAGLPVLTCVTSNFAGRVAASLLTALDLTELITSNPADYEATAIALAHDSIRLAAIRAKLFETQKATPLFDTRGFVEDLERAYDHVFKTHQAGAKPKPFNVPAKV